MQDVWEKKKNPVNAQLNQSLRELSGRYNFTIYTQLRWGLALPPLFVPPKTCMIFVQCIQRAQYQQEILLCFFGAFQNISHFFGGIFHDTQWVSDRYHQRCSSCSLAWCFSLINEFIGLRKDVQYGNALGPCRGIGPIHARWMWPGTLC